jgi:ribosomal protein S18 acetylase RimI-like enzyme
MAGPVLVRVTPENVDEIGVHCVAGRSHPGRQAKIEWFKREYGRGLRLLLLVPAASGKSVGFIEYAPGESAWRAVDAPGHLVVHCLWVNEAGKGHGSRLIRAVVAEAEEEARDGVAVVTSSGTWCAKSAIYEKNGFELVDESGPFGLYLRRVGTSARAPRLAKPRASGADEPLVFRHSAQCPFVAKAVGELSAEAHACGVRLKLRELQGSRDARRSPTPYGVTSLERGGRVLADHAISRTRFRNILRQEGLLS